MSYDKAYYLANKEKIKDRQRAYYLANKEKIKRYKKQYAQKNRDKYRKSSREYMQRNPAIRKKCREKWRKYKNLVKEYNGCLNPECKWEGEYDASILDFHHLEASSKSFTISKTSVSMCKLQTEMHKCTIICANCHRLITCGVIIVNFKPMQLPDCI